MNNEIIQGGIETTTKTPIEILLGIDEEGKTTARKLYDFLELATGQFSRWAKSNITDNTFAVEGVDYEGFDITVEGNQVKDYRLTATFAKKLSMTQKNERGEEARTYFVIVENTLKEAAIQMTQLSPQLQLLINIETEQRNQAKALADTNARMDGALEIIALSTNSWRQDARSLIKKIALKMGGYEYLGDVQSEIYKLLDERFAVSLKTRLTFKRQRMAEEGVCKSKRDKLTWVDIIAEDKKLIEGYVAIVKEMAVKYGVGDGV